MPRKSAGSLNIKSFVKDIIESNGIATAKNIEQILKRLDKLEAKISSIKITPVKRTGTKGGKEKRVTTTGPVLDVITKSKKGASLDTIQSKTGFDKAKINNAIFILSKAGKIKRKSRGVYELVKEQLAKQSKPQTQKKKQAPKKQKPVKKAVDKGNTKDSTPSEMDASTAKNSN